MFKTKNTMRKETFAAILTALTEYRRRNSELDSDLQELWRKHRPEQTDFLKDTGVALDDWELYDDLTSALATAFDYPDALDDLNWWFHETPLLPPDCRKVTFRGTDWPTDTPEQLYDYMSEMQREFENGNGKE